MSGQAPGAKILSSRACLFNTGCTTHALTEGMIQIVRDGADIVNMSIGGLPALNDGFNTRCDIYNRLINKKGVQIVLSNGNSGPGLNTAGDPAVCADAVAMGAYLSKASMRSNYGADTPFDDNLNYFSSVGPAEDGGFKPEAIAPGSAVSTTPEWQAGGPVPGTYTLPPGYSMFNGTSMASPQGAGAGALLLSAAKASGFSAEAGPAPQGDALDRPLHRSGALHGRHAGQRHPERAGGLGRPQDEARDGRLHRDRAGQHRPERLPARRRASARGSTTVRA